MGSFFIFDEVKYICNDDVIKFIYLMDIWNVMCFKNINIILDI